MKLGLLASIILFSASSWATNGMMCKVQAPGFNTLFINFEQSSSGKFTRATLDQYNETKHRFFEIKNIELKTTIYKNDNEAFEATVILDGDPLTIRANRTFSYSDQENFIAEDIMFGDSTGFPIMLDVTCTQY